MKLPAYAMGQASFPEMYERLLVGPLFRPFAELTVERAQLRAGDRVLDVACGTGIVARLAKNRVGDGGTVVGVDLSPPMIAVARSIEPSVEWREGDACALPVRDPERFDVVMCQQGLQFFPDKVAAAREMRRVLAPGGRLLVSAWRSEDPIARELRLAAEAHVGPVADQRWGFGDADAIRDLVEHTGFRDVRVETVSRTIRFPDGVVYVHMNAMALVGMSRDGASLSEEDRGRTVEAIVADSADVLRRHTDDRGFAFELATNLATARG
jgi:ubiquinone/menaquinone biosynthesis C-methylase UbiE